MNAKRENPTTEDYLEYVFKFVRTMRDVKFSTDDDEINCCLSATIGILQFVNRNDHPGEELTLEQVLEKCAHLNSVEDISKEEEENLHNMLFDLITVVQGLVEEEDEEEELSIETDKRLLN